MLKKYTLAIKNIGFIILICSTAVSSCKTMSVVSNNPMSVQAVQVIGTHQQRVTRSVSSVAADVDDSREGLLRHHLQAMMAQGGPNLVSDNEAKLLIDGPQTYKAMFNAIEQAHNHINIEVYIFQDDEVGKKLSDLLVEKQHQGVQVKLIYDSLGCISTSKYIFKKLTDAGAKVHEFNPVNPIEGKALDFNNRDHRKILVVDGTVGYTGGINISSVYSQGSSFNVPSALTDNAPRDEGWRDTQIEIRGPAVAELQKIFLHTWNQFNEDEASGAEADKKNSAQYFPSLGHKGDKVVRVIASSPDDKKNIIYADLLTAIRQARHSVHLTMAYFSPGEPTLNELRNAARRGVDVTLVLPGFSDIWLIFEAGRAHYSSLLKSGVKIYERRDALLHAKTAVIDGVWSTVGSTNMDMRSFLHNNEVNVVILGSDFGDDMEEMFRRDIASGTPVTREAWSRRPLMARLRQLFSSIWSYWL
jgi:cardiolipin synthase